MPQEPFEISGYVLSYVCLHDVLHVLADSAEPDVHLPGVHVRHHQLQHMAPIMLQLLFICSLQLPIRSK
jgi:hypothetical protein